MALEFLKGFFLFAPILICTSCSLKTAVDKIPHLLTGIWNNR